jgi:outer membrane protein OmpA-like peptidoglycan-associated protein/tetratricopeptide (TPR) repeat protein
MNSMKNNKKYKYAFIIALVFILYPVYTYAQENVKIKRTEFFTKEDGFSDAMKNIRKGNKEYKFGKATYREAREFYLRAYKYNDKNAELNYKIGVCYLYSDDKFQAIKYLTTAFQLKKDVADDIHFQLARAYHMNYDFDNAEKEYKDFKSSLSPRKFQKLNINIDKYLTECENGKTLASHPIRVVVQDLGKTINSEYDDYYPVLDSKEQTMYFTSRRPSKTNKKRNLNDQKFEEAIYVSKLHDKVWSTAQLLSRSISDKTNTAALALSPDDKRLYLYKPNGNGDIYYTEQKNSKWIKPKKVKKINSGARETSVSITGDGKKLYFVSDREKGSLGGKDIYFSDLDANGKWSKPKNIGTPVNSSEDEEGVSISKDGKTLYFSSKGHSTSGGYDIFTSTLNDNGNWSEPVNLGYPINTPDDDLFFSMMGNGRVAYLSSNREQSIGEKDIYKIIYLGAAKEMVMTTASSPLAFVLYDSKTLFRNSIPEFAVDTSIILTGKVLDSETKKPIFAKLEFIDSQKSTVVSTLLTDTAGGYKTHIPERKQYGVQITAKGYLFYLDTVNLKGKNTDIVTKDFYLQGLEVGAKVVMKSIFFESGKSTIKDESFQQLNAAIEFMKENPSLTIEVSGHTDNVGSLYSNLKLSQARAKAVVDFMTKQGIDKSRLTFKGYGPNQPVAPNTTADGRAQNRRVEFKITGK